jgi:translation initiation factor 3 subunit F
MEDASVIFGTQVNVKVHPVVIFNILDHFIRRQEGQDRVVGTLLGANVDGAIEIRNCFPVPHYEGEQVAVDMEFHRNMCDLHQRTAPKEVIVGWYATGLDITENSVIIHDFYASASATTAVHLLIDTALTNDTLGIRAYVGSNLSFGEKNLGAYFQPVSMEMLSLDVDRVGFEVLSRTKDDQVATLASDLTNLKGSIVKLMELIDTVLTYVEKVRDGEIKGDNAIGRFLTKTVSVLPKFDPEALDKLFNNNIQDLLMVVYLANLTRTQIAVAEKLQKTLP